MRRPGFRDAWIGLKLYDLRREAEMRKARQMVGTHVLGKSTAEVLALLDYAHPENAHLRQVTTYWEMAASFVVRGVLHPEVFEDTCSEALFTYAAFEPHVAAIRAKRPLFLKHVEAAIRGHENLGRRLQELKARFAPPA